MRVFWKTAADELSAGRRVFASFVVANRKGSPGTPAARLLALEDGRQVGTIGGGIMEQQLLVEARQLLSSGEKLRPSLRVLRHNKSDLDLASGLICGGEQTNLSLILEGSDDLARLKDVIEALDANENRAIEITESGLRLIPGKLDDGSQYQFIHDNLSNWIYRLNLVNLRRIAIYGGGHCGVALAQTMEGLGYAVSIVEPRQSLFTLSRLEDEISHIDVGFSEAAKHILFPEITIAVVMTYSMPTDVESLDGILHFPFYKIGLMGSALKIAQIRKKLAEIGHSDLQIARVRAPIGLDFDSDTPEEIAISIAAQILLERNGKE
ncbi:MAG: XdhC family protein [Verrucomicrobiota bacterium]